MVHTIDEILNEAIRVHEESKLLPSGFTLSTQERRTLATKLENALEGSETVEQLGELLSSWLIDLRELRGY